MKNKANLKSNSDEFDAILDTPNSPVAWSESALYAKYKLLRISDVSELTTLAKSTINLWEATSRFPKSMPLAPNIKVWTFESVSNWIKTQGECHE